MVVFKEYIWSVFLFKYDLRQEPAQHNIDPSKLVEDVCPKPGNDQQTQHNDHNYVFIYNCSPACQCVCCSSLQPKLKNLQNEYDEFKEIVQDPDFGQQETNQPY